MVQTLHPEPGPTHPKPHNSQRSGSETRAPQPGIRRNGAAVSPEMRVFAPPCPFFKNV